LGVPAGRSGRAFQGCTHAPALVPRAKPFQSPNAGKKLATTSETLAGAEGQSLQDYQTATLYKIPKGYLYSQNINQPFRH